MVGKKNTPGMKYAKAVNSKQGGCYQVIPPQCEVKNPMRQFSILAHSGWTLLDMGHSLGGEK